MPSVDPAAKGDARDPAGGGQDLLGCLAGDVRRHVVGVLRDLRRLDAAAASLNRTQGEILRAAGDCVEHMRGITGDILDLAACDAAAMRLDKTRFNLIDAVGEAIRHCRGVGIDKGIWFAVAPESAAAPTLADRPRVVRVLVHLLLNATHVSPSGGRVLVSCGWRNGVCTAAVIDEGPGIPAHQRLVVFEKYRRVPRQGSPRRALGVGLYFCRRIVEAHGGRIWIESSLRGRDRGTRVAFTLPESHA